MLLSYSKIVLFQQLLDSDVPEDPYLSKELVRYFPQPLQDKYAKAMESHRLKREIIATAVTNSMVNRMGATFILRMQEDTGRTPAEVAKAYTIAREALDARDLWAQIDALDGKVPESVQIDALQVIWHLLRSMSRAGCCRVRARSRTSPRAVARYRDGLNAVRGAVPRRAVRRRAAPATRRSMRDWKGKGLPAALAEQLAALPLLELGCDIIEIALARKLPAGRSRARCYFAPRRGAAPAVAVRADRAAAGRRPLAGAGPRRAARRAGDAAAHAGRADPRRWRQEAGRSQGRGLAQARRFLAALHPAMFADLRSQKTLDYPTAVGGGAAPGAGGGRGGHEALRRCSTRSPATAPGSLFVGRRAVVAPRRATHAIAAGPGYAGHIHPEPPMTATPRIAFLASPAEEAQRALRANWSRATASTSRKTPTSSSRSAATASCCRRCTATAAWASRCTA